MNDIKSDFKKLPQTISTRDGFITVNGNNIIVSLEIKNGELKPLRIPNKPHLFDRAKNILELIPEYGKIAVDGNYIEIDVISKTIEIDEIDQPNGSISGILHYKTNSEYSRFYMTNADVGIKHIPSTEKSIADKLKIFNAILRDGFAMSIADQHKKELLISTIGNSETIGFVDTQNPTQMTHLAAIMRFWPELELEFKITNNEFKINCKKLATYGRGLIKLSKYSSSDVIEVSQPYL